MSIGEFLLGNSETKLTKDGGMAIRKINKTGAPSVKGTIVSPHPTIKKAVILCPIDSEKLSGVVYDQGVPDGQFFWVVISGKAFVLHSNAVLLDSISRIPITVDTGTKLPGYAYNGALGDPFGTDKRFRIVGLPNEAGAAMELIETDIRLN